MDSTIAQLPYVLAAFAKTLSALPYQLSNTTASLPSLLNTLSTDLTPLLPTIAAAEEDALLSNATWLAENIGALSALTAQIPQNSVQHASKESLIAMIQTGTTTYNVTTLWSPDLGALVMMFALVIVTKLALISLLTGKSISRVRAHAVEQGKTGITRDVARLILQKPLRSAIGHTVNLVAGTVVLGLQLASYRLFIIPYAPIRFVDIKMFSLGMKILQASYAADLLFGDLNPEIFLHHLFTAALLQVGQVCVFKTGSPLFFTMANMLILQATTEQSTYLAMALFHSASALKLQNHLPHRQRSLIKASWAVLTFTKFITFPQKIVPAVLCLTVLGRMWNDIDGSAYGRWWLGWSTIFISILLLLQVKFCDDVFPICNYVHYRLYPDAYSHPPSRTGPVMRFLSSLMPGAARRRERVREAHRLRAASAASAASSAPITIKVVRSAPSEESMASRYDEEKRLDMEHAHPFDQYHAASSGSLPTLSYANTAYGSASSSLSDKNKNGDDSRVTAVTSKRSSVSDE
ncbi:hypothetical protein BCR35DRAFT_329831 [Leucosporidium creatinivorum]|uniref:Uncharacterized protein n=1 Tax=Leucosporidium creatinivorum TaxID=106004 RepID=A0A1Y2FX15_9BASI|nr:hypothetical protein BCR35DRAFT_329831 [Leucosporidium creatinivorum]